MNDEHKQDDNEQALRIFGLTVHEFAKSIGADRMNIIVNISEKDGEQFVRIIRCKGPREVAIASVMRGFEEAKALLWSGAKTKTFLNHPVSGGIAYAVRMSLSFVLGMCTHYGANEKIISGISDMILALEESDEF